LAKDLAYALALAADVDTGPRPVPAWAEDVVLAPAYASCVSYFLERTQDAYLGFLGSQA